MVQTVAQLLCTWPGFSSLKETSGIYPVDGSQTYYGIIYNDSLYTTDLYISAYNILVCETIVDQDQQRL